MSKRKEGKRLPCTACKKSLVKRDQFYRNGNYFCNNDCFKKFQVAEAERKAKEAEQAAV